MGTGQINTSVRPPKSLALRLRSVPPGLSSPHLALVMPMIKTAGATAHAQYVPDLYEIKGPLQAINSLEKQLAVHSSVEYVHPVQYASIQLAPNDPHFTNGDLWHLNGTFGINAPPGWNVSTGSNKVIVGDVDTGIDYGHPDLANNVWINQSEIPSSLIGNLTDVDGDGVITFYDLNQSINQGSGKIVDTNSDGVINGYDLLASTGSGGWASGSTQDGDTSHVDDLIGWNFIAGTNSPLDDNNHGTFTAGEIGAVGNNGVGVTGVNWRVQLMAVKTFGSTGLGSDVGIANGMHYAVDHGAKVINASWGSSGLDATIASAISYANSNGVILVAAAGNNSSNDDTTFWWPASYSTTYPNVISVASTNIDSNLSSFSNYGTGTVQLGAPGNTVYGTFPGNSYGTDSGTSMAAPLVTGAVALLIAAYPTWSMSQIINAILNNVTKVAGLTSTLGTGGILNVGAALNSGISATMFKNTSVFLPIERRVSAHTAMAIRG